MNAPDYIFVLSSNGADFPGLAVAMASAAMRSPRRVRVRVIDGGLSARQRTVLRRVGMPWGCDLEFVSVPDGKDGTCGLPPVRGFAYARLWCDVMFPGEEWVVYCDTDILVRRDPAGALQSLTGGSGLAAWVNPQRSLADDPVGSPHSDGEGIPYFETGFLAMNLRDCRNSGILSRAREFAAARYSECRHFDQSALNQVVRGDVAPLERGWNWAIEFDSPGGEGARAEGGTANLHFIGRSKPWLFFSRREEYALWRSAFSRAAKLFPSYVFHPLFLAFPLYARWKHRHRIRASIS